MTFFHETYQLAVALFTGRDSIIDEFVSNRLSLDRLLGNLKREDLPSILEPSNEDAEHSQFMDEVHRSIGGLAPCR